MRLASLIPVLLAGAVSTARAAPDKTETTDRVSYKGERAETVEPADGWVELASPTPASHGRVYITLDPEQGAIARLRITGDTGRPLIEGVRVVFGDGKSKYIKLERIVSKQKPAVVTLDGARKIDRIVVDTRGSKKSTYSIHGELDSAAVATR